MDEKKPPRPANGSLDGPSGPDSTTSGERNGEKGSALDAVPPSSPDIRDDKAEMDVKAVAAAPEEPAKRKGKTALIMIAICVRKVQKSSGILRI
jgi:hypothetical protein